MYRINVELLVSRSVLKHVVPYVRAGLGCGNAYRPEIRVHMCFLPLMDNAPWKRRIGIAASLER